MSTIPTLAEKIEDPYTIVYLGAPYNMGLTEPAMDLLARHSQLLAGDAVCVVETRSSETLAERYGDLTQYRQKRYGVTSFWFFTPRG